MNDCPVVKNVRIELISEGENTSVLVYAKGRIPITDIPGVIVWRNRYFVMKQIHSIGEIVGGFKPIQYTEVIQPMHIADSDLQILV